MALFTTLFSKPQTIELSVTSSNGFHLRPIAQFVSAAKTFPCDITATFNHKQVNAKGVNTLLSLSLEKGDRFSLTAQGKQSAKALQTLQHLFENLMHQDKAIKPTHKEHHSYKGGTLKGECIAEGIAIAPLYRYTSKEVVRDSSLGFQEALQRSLEELESLSALPKEGDRTSIYLAQKALLASLGEPCHTLTEFEQCIAEASTALTGTQHEAKKADYQDLLQRIKKHLGVEVNAIFPTTPFILLADDLLPSEIDLLTQTKVTGVILKAGSIHSHTAILLRSAGITSLIGNSSMLQEGADTIVDAYSAVAVYAPTAEDLAEAKERLNAKNTNDALASSKRFKPAMTRSHTRVKVLANVSDMASTKLAKEAGAEGIGLLRTEFLFKEKKPTLEQQSSAYRAIFSYFDEVTVRTLDVGGDKVLPYLALPKENNPFLGIRGVRLFQTHPALMEEQLHAIFLAAKGRSIKVMFPMVSSVAEFTHAKAFAQKVAKKHHIDISLVAFGMMIEVPSVLFELNAFNEVVDFYSIGTNDLIQYLFAIERTHPILKPQTHAPSLFAALRHIVKHTTKPLSICGELAADSEAITTLLHLGIETLSVSPKRIAQTKETIRDV